MRVADRHFLSAATTAWQRLLKTDLDPCALRPRDLTMILNSTDVGPVLVERTLRRHRDRAGFRIGDGRKIDFFRYSAWLYDERHAPPAPSADSYESHRARTGRVQREKAEAAQDIGEIPAVRRPRVRARAKRDCEFFLKAYIGDTLYEPFSADQKRYIAMLSEVVLHGGKHAIALPRGGGKSKIAEGVMLWAILNGLRSFGCIVAGTEELAEARLSAIKMHVEKNDRLLQDYPEVCYVIRKLDRTAQRKLRYRGELLTYDWRDETLIFPDVPGAESFGAAISTRPITGHVVGQGFTRSDLKTIRPDFVIVDDAQTRETARNPVSTKYLMEIIRGDVLGLAGPGKEIAAVACCTVIYRDDLSDRLIDRERHPEWQGVRGKLLYEFPTRMDLWKIYADKRRQNLGGEYGRKLAEAAATDFYLENFEVMNAGAAVGSEHRKNEGDLTALQFAMNIWADDPDTFHSEFQNEPLSQHGDDELLTANEICHRLNGFERALVPTRCQYLTAMIDVQQACLYWGAVAWDLKFGGAVIDYGTFPEQPQTYFRLREIQDTIQIRYRQQVGAGGYEAALRWALLTLFARLATREWMREDGTPMRIGKLLVDCGDGDVADLIYDAVRESPHASIITPSFGRGFGAKFKPINNYEPRPGEHQGYFWRLGPVPGKQRVQRVMMDVNHWKSFVHRRLATALGDPGGLTLWGTDPETHRMFADHLTAEHRDLVTANGNSVWEWAANVGHPDNHLFDIAVGCAAAASMLGLKAPGEMVTAVVKPHERPSLSQLKRSGRG